jgi:hypothetical protein
VLTGILVVLPIAVGLPLLAWWIGRRAVVVATAGACLVAVALVVVRCFLGEAGGIDVLALSLVAGVAIAGPATRWWLRWLVRHNAEAGSGARP